MIGWVGDLVAAPLIVCGFRRSAIQIVSSDSAVWQISVVENETNGFLGTFIG